MILYKVEVTYEDGKKHNDLCIWYSPCEIIFNYEQNIWIIENVLPLDYGEWMQEPLNCDSEETTVSCSATFESICVVMAEFRDRLAHLPIDPRESLVDEVQGGLRHHRLLSRPAKRALVYISGKPRKQSYGEWQWQNKHRDKKGEK